MSKDPSPFFELEEEKLTRNLEIINSVQEQAEIAIIVAFKGFAMWSAFPLMKEYISGATASSLNEAMLCKEEMKVLAHTYCVAYDPNEFDEIVTCSSHLTFNSLTQYHSLIDRVPMNKSVGLRVNPGWSDVTTDLYNPSSATSRLGIQVLDEIPDRVEGLHFHVLCESDSYALEKVLEHFEARFGHFLDGIKWVNMGGGHSITREGYDLNHLVSLIRRFKSKYGVEVILEPGSAFAWEAGSLRTTVLDIVEGGGQKTAIIDASFTCHMPDCLEMPYRPNISGANSEHKDQCYKFRIGGVSCLAGDYLDSYWFDKELTIGDQIVFNDMIHYTMVKSNMFNGVKHPAIAIKRKDGSLETVRTFSYQDYKGRLS